MSGNDLRHNREREHYIGIGMAIGMPAFSFLGIILCIATDNPGLLGLAPATGLALGIAIGEGLYRRSRRADGS